jgi:type IV pilus assembly protein PilA
MRQMLKNKLKEQKGFTLIELLAVIVILGLLAAIAIPSITHIVEKSKADAIKSDAKIILNAAKLYEADGNEIDATNGVDESKLGKYVDHVTTFDSGYDVKANGAGGALTITGNGQKGNVKVNFTNTELDDIDDVVPTK